MSDNVEPIEELKSSAWTVPTKRDIEMEIQQQDLTTMVEQCGILMVRSDVGSRRARRISLQQFDNQQELHQNDKQKSLTQTRTWYIAMGCISVAGSFGSAFVPLSPINVFSQNAVKAGSAALTAVSRAGDTAQQTAQSRDRQRQDHFDYLKTRSAEAGRARQEEIRSDNNQNIHSALNAIKEANDGRARTVQSIFTN